MSNDYQRIKGLGTGLGGIQNAFMRRLYAHPDHLLIIQSSIFSEEYKRVFYRDIRYVVMQKNYSQEIQAIISGCLVLACLGISLTGIPWWIPATGGALFLTWFVINWIKGSAGRCYANTATQTVQLAAPRRINKLPVLIEFLGSKIPGA